MIGICGLRCSIIPWVSMVGRVWYGMVCHLNIHEEQAYSSLQWGASAMTVSTPVIVDIDGRSNDGLN